MAIVEFLFDLITFNARTFAFSDMKRFKIVVRERGSSRVVWNAHGCRQAPFEFFETVCGEIDYFTLAGFLRRRRPGYFS